MPTAAKELRKDETAQKVVLLPLRFSVPANGARLKNPYDNPERKAEDRAMVINGYLVAIMFSTGPVDFGPDGPMKLSSKFKVYKGIPSDRVGVSYDEHYVFFDGNILISRDVVVNLKEKTAYQYYSTDNSAEKTKRKVHYTPKDGKLEIRDDKGNAMMTLKVTEGVITINWTDYVYVTEIELPKNVASKQVKPYPIGIRSGSAPKKRGKIGPR